MRQKETFVSRDLACKPILHLVPDSGSSVVLAPEQLVPPNQISNWVGFLAFLQDDSLHGLGLQIMWGFGM